MFNLTLLLGPEASEKFLVGDDGGGGGDGGGKGD